MAALAGSSYSISPDRGEAGVSHERTHGLAEVVSSEPSPPWNRIMCVRASGASECWAAELRTHPSS